MDNNVSVGDLRTFFQHTVCMYKNRPVRVREISNNKIFMMTDLLSQKTTAVADAIKYITPPVRRLGMVNILGSVLYMKRMPYRKYQIGISHNNTKIDTIAGVGYPDGRDQTKTVAKGFNDPGIANCMLDIYPSLQESWEIVKEFEGASAFDKQFCIDTIGNIYYKLIRVGTFGKKQKSISDIVFFEEYKHLILLLDGNHEKTIRDFGTSSFA